MNETEYNHQLIQDYLNYESELDPHNRRGASIAQRIAERAGGYEGAKIQRWIDEQNAMYLAVHPELFSEHLGDESDPEKKRMLDKSRKLQAEAEEKRRRWYPKKKQQ